jgi:nucleotide-binding universal stress UspA family protein
MSRPWKTIVWATDGSPESDAALDEALRLNGAPPDRLVAVHCDQRMVGRAGSWPAYADEEKVIDRIRKRVAGLRSDGLKVNLVIRASYHDPSEVVATVASEFGADVIVAGTRGYGGISAAFHGSVSRALLHTARCPVLVVPKGAQAVEAERDELATVA